MASNQNFVIRETTLDDYEAVMAIDTNVYGGLDYLPFMYKEYMMDPRRTGFVLEIDGRIEGFCLHFVVDDAQTLVVQAARIALNTRAAGLFKYFRHATVDKTVQKYPTITRSAVTSMSKEFVMSKIRSRMWPFDFILQRPFIEAVMKPGSEFDVQPLNSTVHNIDAGQMKPILMHPENQWKLFPHRRIVISMEPFKLLESNIDKITDMSLECLCTLEENDSVRCSTVSFGHANQSKVGLRYDIEVYGNDLQEALDHVGRQLQLSYKYHKQGQNFIWAFLPLAFPETEVKHHLERHYAFERDLKIRDSSLFEVDVGLKAQI